MAPRALVEEIAKSYPVPLRLIANATNLGFCAANNQGIFSTDTELVALLNNDAEAEPGWLEALERAIRQGEDVGMAASKVLVWEDPTRIDKCGHLIYPDGQNRGRGSGQTDRGQFDRTEEVLWPDGCAAMYRRAMLEDIGGFDEDFFAYADDAELGLRARWAGWRCLYTPDAVVRHHRGATLGLGSARRLTLIERNRVSAGGETVSLELAVGERRLPIGEDRGGNVGSGPQPGRDAPLSGNGREVHGGAGPPARNGAGGSPDPRHAAQAASLARRNGD